MHHERLVEALMRNRVASVTDMQVRRLRQGGQQLVCGMCGEDGRPVVVLGIAGAFQYLDHLEDPAAFVAEVFEHARALLLILDNVDAPVAIQHATGWGRAPLAWLADAHGKRLVDDFAAITPSGNHAWLLCDD